MGMEVRSDGWKICFRTLNSEQPTCTTSKGAGTVCWEGAGSGDWEWYIGRELGAGTGSCCFFGGFFWVFLFNHTCIVVQI